MRKTPPNPHSVAEVHRDNAPAHRKSISKLDIPFLDNEKADR